MGFGFDLVTDVRSIERKPDGTYVEIELAKGAMVSRQVQVMRARARALIASGVVDVVGSTSRDIGKAIMNMDAGRIQRATEVVDGERRGDTVTVKVNE